MQKITKDGHQNNSRAPYEDEILTYTFCMMHIQRFFSPTAPICYTHFLNATLFQLITPSHGTILDMYW